MMRIRTPFAAAFGTLVVFAGYIGLAPLTIPTYYHHDDKVLHFITFFLLTLIFYWILDTNRRRVIQVTLAVCTGAMAVGSEVVQGVIPNGRTFDYLDIFGNVAGSLAALGLNTMYHKRMLERKRAARGYRSIGGDEELGGAGLDDVELEEGTSAQESGVVAVAPQETATLDDDLDKWDENAEDWSDPDDEPTTTAPANGTSSVVKPPLPDMGKKRDD